MRRLLLLATILVSSPLAANDALLDYLRSNGRVPAEYILSKTDDYRLVIVGENHWFRRDAELVASLVPDLRRSGAMLAMEFFVADEQQRIDALVTAPAWDGKRANEIMRASDWPYVQYRDILHAAWKANQATDRLPPFRIIAMGPPRDFRDRGIRYDEFMAERLMENMTDSQRHIVAYCGAHHAFTRYLQVERRQRGRATEFMNRFGNILWRRYGQDVFLIMLDKPEMCGSKAPETKYCLPFDGAVESAAAMNGTAVAFDIFGSPVAELKFPSASFYSFGHPLLRFIDYADGYVWTEPIERLRMVDLIPLAEYAPEKAADPERVAAWKKRAEDLAHPLDRPAWRQLAAGRCP